MPKGLSKRQFVELFNSLPEEKKDYGLFYTPKGFMTFRKIFALVEKEDKASRELKDRFIAGRFWEKPSCISLPTEYKAVSRAGNTITVCSALTDMVELGKLVDIYDPTDIEWEYQSQQPCNHLIAKNNHYMFFRNFETILKKRNEK